MRRAGIVSRWPSTRVPLGSTGLPSTSIGSSTFAMNEDPLGDFELICESRARRALRPSSDRLAMEFCSRGISGECAGRSCANDAAASTISRATDNGGSRLIEVLASATIDDTLAVASPHDCGGLRMGSRIALRVPSLCLARVILSGDAPFACEWAGGVEGPLVA